jgi:ribosome biogenesis SPOUT family RNA methylase Rps3
MGWTTKLYVVEHLDPELGSWSKLEYLSIAEESSAAGSEFCLSSVPSTLELPRELRGVPGLRIEAESAEAFLADRRARVCLLDPSAARDLSPEDGDIFDIFLFGGILGMLESRHKILLVRVAFHTNS